MAAKIDAEIDLHGYTADSARAQLDTWWSRSVWQSMRRVRVIHGTGEVLFRVVRQWADDKAIPWTLETYNPGVTILQPSLRRDEPAAVWKPFAGRLKELLSASEKQTGVSRSASKPGQSGSATDHSKEQSHDLFGEEMERLKRQDRTSVHKRKHGA